MSGEEISQSWDCRGEGPEDFQQMILLYRECMYEDYTNLEKNILASVPVINLELDPMGFTIEGIQRSCAFFDSNLLHC